MNANTNHYGFDNYLQSFESFKHLPANTDIHKDRHGNFVATGGSYAWIKGAQTLANYAKGHQSEKLAQDISEFSISLIKKMNTDFNLAIDTEETKIKKKVYEEIDWITHEIEQAMKGKGPHGGLEGLIETYKDDSIHDSLEKSIKAMKHQAVFCLQTLKDNLSLEDTTISENEEFEEDFVTLDFPYIENVVNLLNEIKFLNQQVKDNPHLFTLNQLKNCLSRAKEVLDTKPSLTNEEASLSTEIIKLKEAYDKKSRIVDEFVQQFAKEFEKTIPSVLNTIKLIGSINSEILNEEKVINCLHSIKEKSVDFQVDILNWSKNCLKSNENREIYVKGSLIIQHQLLKDLIQNKIESGALGVVDVEESVNLLAQADQNIHANNMEHLRSVDMQTSLAIAYNMLAEHYRNVQNNGKCLEALEKAANIPLLSTHSLGNLQDICQRALNGSFWTQVDGTAVRRRQVRIQQKTVEQATGGTKNFLDLSFTLPRSEIKKINKQMELLIDSPDYLKAKGILVEANVNFIYTALKKNVYEAEGKSPQAEKDLGEAIRFKDSQGKISLTLGRDPDQWNQYEKISIKIDPTVTTQQLHVFLSTLGLPTVLLSSRYEDILNENTARVFNSMHPNLITKNESPDDWIAMGIKSKDKDVILERAKAMTLKDLGLGRTEYVDQIAVSDFVKAGGAGFGATIGFDSVKLSPKALLTGDIYKKKTIEDSAWTLSLILKGGMLSTFERFEKGFFGNGCCPEENIKVGAGNQVFLRPLTENQFQENYKWSDYAIEGNVFLLVDAKAAERLPYGYPVDRAGLRNKTHVKEKYVRMAQKELPSGGLKGSQVKDRAPLKEICKKQFLQDRTLPTAEVLFEDVLPANYITGAVVKTEIDKSIVIKTLKDNNITNINGKPIEECIFVSKSLNNKMKGN